MKTRTIKFILTLSFILFSLPQAHASSDALKSAIADAKFKSDDEQRVLKNKAQVEKADRMDSWAVRDDLAIEIKNTGFSGASNYDIGIDADLDEEESGVDSSGLNGLRSKVEEESTDIDFDAELREVSQVTVD